jgi:hypothetical protein
MAYCKFRDRPPSQGSPKNTPETTVATVATVARGTGQISRPETHHITTETPQIGRGTPATMATVATEAGDPDSPAQRNTVKTHLSSADPGDIPNALRRCAHCGSSKPTPNLVAVDGMTVYLHYGCETAYNRHRHAAHRATNGNADLSPYEEDFPSQARKRHRDVDRLRRPRGNR